MRLKGTRIGGPMGIKRICLDAFDYGLLVRGERL